MNTNKEHPVQDEGYTSIHWKHQQEVEQLQQRISQLEQERKDIASDAWDAALKRKYCEMAMESNLWNRPEMPPDKAAYLSRFEQTKTEII